MLGQHLIGRAFSQLLRLEALVTIVIHLFAVVACNMHKIFYAFWHLLAPQARHGGIGTTNGCNLMLSVERLFAVLRCVALLYLF